MKAKHGPVQHKVIEWVPGKWWLVAVTGPDGSYTPLHEGKGETPADRKSDCERVKDGGL